MSARRRLDQDLVRRELASSRSEAQRLIEQRQVTVNGAIAQKSAHLVAKSDAVEITGERARFVGRGGEKMLAAIENFALDVSGKHCLDVGASTGGFSDCLLQHNAAHVVAVDVGRAQLHERLKAHPKLSSFERCDIRTADPKALGAPFDLIVVDVSFISLKTILPALLVNSSHSTSLVLLIKPQFEAGKKHVDKGRGVIKDPDVWADVLHQVCEAYSEAGFALDALCVSPIKGGSGNVEFLGLFARQHLTADGELLSSSQTQVEQPNAGQPNLKLSRGSQLTEEQVTDTQPQGLAPKAAMEKSVLPAESQSLGTQLIRHAISQAETLS